jgi:general stress protein 26
MPATDIPSETLSTLIRGMQVAMLTTRSLDGALHSRPMAIVDEEIRDQLWFFTGRGSHSVADIANLPQVNVSYTDSATQRYVSVSGHAVPIKDRERMRALWRDEFATWFPHGIDDPDLILLRIDVDRVDFWQSPATGPGRTMAFARALVDADPIAASQLG